jgi:hypothetical protein
MTVKIEEPVLYGNMLELRQNLKERLFGVIREEMSLNYYLDFFSS